MKNLIDDRTKLHFHKTPPLESDRCFFVDVVRECLEVSPTLLFFKCRLLRPIQVCALTFDTQKNFFDRWTLKFVVWLKPVLNRTVFHPSSFRTLSVNSFWFSRHSPFIRCISQTSTKFSSESCSKQRYHRTRYLCLTDRKCPWCKSIRYCSDIRKKVFPCS